MGSEMCIRDRFYAGEPTSEAATGRVTVSINSSVPGSALYLNTTRATDLDGDGEARFDEAGTGFREITNLYEGRRSASSPTVDGGDPSLDRRYPDGLKAQLNPSFHLVPLDDGYTSYQLLQAGWSRNDAGTLSFEAWSYILEPLVDPTTNRVEDVKTFPAFSLDIKVPEPETTTWHDDVSLTPVWSDQDGDGNLDLLLGNWIWSDPLKLSLIHI